MRFSLFHIICQPVPSAVRPDFFLQDNAVFAGHQCRDLSPLIKMRAHYDHKYHSLGNGWYIIYHQIVRGYLYPWWPTARMRSEGAADCLCVCAQLCVSSRFNSLYDDLFSPQTIYTTNSAGNENQFSRRIFFCVAVYRFRTTAVGHFMCGKITRIS